MDPSNQSRDIGRPSGRGAYVGELSEGHSGLSEGREQTTEMVFFISEDVQFRLATHLYVPSS